MLGRGCRAVRILRSVCSTQLQRAEALALSAASAVEGRARGATSFASHASPREFLRCPLSRVNGAAAFRLFASASEAPEAEPVDVLEVEVVTGEVRGAGTIAPAFITLVGSRGESEEIELSTETQGHFAPGSRHKYTFRVPGTLGEIEVARLRLAAENDLRNEGWYVEQVVVRRSTTGEQFRFPARKWFGHGDSGSGVFSTLQDLQAQSEEDSHGADQGNHAHMPLLKKPLVFKAGGAAVPHAEKMKKGMRAVVKASNGHGGEDAYFMMYGKEGRFAMGVADGVYMWREQGIDAGLFSRGLMESAAAATSKGCVSPLSMMQKAYKATLAQGLQGSATICLVALDSLHGVAESANIGDSGYLLMRPPRGPGEKVVVKYRSPHQEHEFGRPYQLGHHANSDKPDDAMVAEHDLHPGDVIVMGTDGLWDNLHDDEIADAVMAGLRRQEAPSAVAQRVLAAAIERAVTKNADTPYARAATENLGMIYSGGKKDDITVLVCITE